MPNEHQEKPQSSPRSTSSGQQEKQCRICYDSDESDPSLGRLFKPCLCAGTISYVHVKCLQKWRLSSRSNNAFWRCPQCRFHYRFARTKAYGLGTNPVVVGFLSSFIFVLLVMLSSFVTNYFLASIEEQSMFGTTYFFVSPIDVAQDLVRAAIRILRDQDILPLEVPQSLKAPIPTRLPEPPGLVGRFIRRFLLGLPVVGVGSLIHMILTLPFMGPLQWVARWRGNRTRRGNDRDLAAAVIIIFIIIGAARALYKVYGYTRKWTERFLTWAEDSILEVN
jgi:hypothetical protein